jgi:hypothetical protein
LEYCSKIPSNDETAPTNINNTEMRDSLTNVHAFNNYFLMAAESISAVDRYNDSLQYFRKHFQRNFWE